MTKLEISALHCDTCSDDLLEVLERKTGAGPFKYRASSRTLLIPAEADFSLVQRILRANKVATFEEGVHQPAGQKEHESHEASHAHHHHHVTEGEAQWKILLVFLMNLVFSIIEFIAGFLINSTAILSDAVHDLGDALSTGVALLLERRSDNHADSRFSFGHRRFSLLGALFTGIILIIGSGFVIAAAVPRLFNPQEVDERGMLWLAIAAIAAHTAVALVIRGSSSRNTRMITLHLIDDLLGWAGVLVVSIVLHFTDWYILDPLMSLVIAAIILREAFRQTYGTVRILMESVPEEVELEDLAEELLGVEGVHGLTHLHMWSMDGEINNFAVTLFVSEGSNGGHAEIKQDVRRIIEPYNVQCSTIEIEFDPDRLFTGKLETAGL